MSTTWLHWPSAKAEEGWQGIRRLELAFTDDGSGQGSGKAELTVHLHRPTTKGLTEQSLRIVGGRRIREIPWRLKEGSGTGASSVSIELQLIGDHSTYTVTLLDGGGMPVHPFFTSADFTFTINCPRGDCRPAPAQAERGHRKRPAVDLLTKDYAGFVRLLSERVQVINPHWADLAPASLERVLVELLSHQGDMLSYHQDRVANEAFVDNATQRYSLRQHGSLLGYKLFDGAAATTVLAFQAENSGFVPAGLEVRMPEGAAPEKVVFYVLERTRVLEKHSELVPAAWPEAADATVPAGATKMLLWGRIDGLMPGQRLAIVQGSFTQVVTLVDVHHELLPGWVEEPTATPAPGDVVLTAVRWEPPLEAELRPWATEGGEKTFHLYGNLATAQFGASRKSAIELAVDRLSADRRNAVVTRERRLNKDVFLLRALRVPEGPVVFESRTRKGGAETSAPVIELSIDNQPWHLVEHLHASHSYDAHYVATADEDGSLWLQFGDGRQGKMVELTSKDHSRMVLRYRVGDPITGNCAIGKLTRIVPPSDDQAAQKDIVELGLRVTNVTPGRGGRQPETKDAVRLRIPASLRHGRLQRAVSVDDYAKAALDVPGVARAAARALGGPFNTVLVLVDPEGQTELRPSVREAVEDRLEAVRMAGREHIVREPEYVPLDVRLAICAQPGALPHRVRDAVYAALRPGSRSRTGFFHPDSLSFGEDIELGDMLAHVQRVAGVRSVAALRFRKLRVAPAAGQVEVRIHLGPTEVARLDADDDFPENGRLEVLMMGVDAGIKEEGSKIVEVV